MATIKLDDLADALDTQLEESSWYVDTRNGALCLLEESLAFFIDNNLDCLLNKNVSDETILALMKSELIDEYDIDALRELAAGYDEAFIFVDPLSSREQYEIMEEFIDGIDDENIRNLLYVAIEGKGAFRRFKDSLAAINQLSEYYAYHDHVLICKAQEWCEEKDLAFE
ncbi:MAG: UPF0158 family protein [Coriobacteriia bacterium]|nr:UPF0158 family protein [Coriobacteriia bacterium]